MRGIVQSVADLSLGRACAGCDAPGTSLCHTCSRLFDAPSHIVHSLALDDVLDGLRIHVWANSVYEAQVRAALIRFKDHGHRSLASTLGHSLNQSISCALAEVGLRSPDEVAIVPIPSRADAVRRRGSDPVATIAHALTRFAEHPLSIVSALTDERGRGSVKKLGSTDRAQMAAGAFHLRGMTTKPIVVVDDIVTTGATLTEACSTLMHAGMNVVAAACVAHTPRT